jgi:copper chaperone
LAEFTLRIEGMHCGACILRVGRALSLATEVTVEEIRLGAARIRSGADPSSIDRAIATLAKAGFCARLEP